MLLNVHVKNMALIKELDIDFNKGLNILTGETGAGKSIIIGSIAIALGAKADRDMVGKNGDYGLVELVFLVPAGDTVNRLIQMGINIEEDNQVIISRKIVNGKSIIKINGETTTLSRLKEVALLLIDVHGQHDYESLLHSEKHMEILDKYAGKEAENLLEKVGGLFTEYKQLQKKYDMLNDDEEKRVRELSFLKFEYNEIEAAALKTGEDEELEEEFEKISHGKKIAEALTAVNSILCEDECSVSTNMTRAIRELSSVNEIDKELGQFYNTLCDADDIISGLTKDICNYLDDFSIDEERAACLRERIDLINHLKMKHGKTIEEILDKYEEMGRKIDELENHDAVKSKIIQDMEKTEAELKKNCDKLKQVRKNAAEKLEKSIKDALVELNFLSVDFKVVVEDRKEYTKKGNDSVEFLISTNPGEECKPLSRIASGGELSRIMLGIKTVLADKDDVDTLIFDEIDTGISGKTAGLVAKKMDEISKTHQVICITHLPQIASYADSHYVIEKDVDDNNKTFTAIYRLEGDQIDKELARMLGGTVITDEAVSNARALRKLAGK